MERVGRPRSSVMPSPSSPSFFCYRHSVAPCCSHYHLEPAPAVRTQLPTSPQREGGHDRAVEIRGNNSLVHTILPDIGITGHHLSQPLWHLSFPAPRAAGRDQRLPSN